MSHDGQFNWHTDERFYAIGSGGPFATVCHALMKHYISDELTLDKGMQLAYRAIATTCDVSSGLVGLPVQLAVVDSGGQRVLDDDEVRKIGVAVDRWKQLESETLLLGAEESSQEVADDLPSLESDGTGGTS
jgi:20S proteasome alpha/beta subunit